MTEQAVPAVEIAQAAVETIASPTVPVIAEDLILAHTLASEIKAKFAGKHRSIKDIFQWLLNIE